LAGAESRKESADMWYDRDGLTDRLRARNSVDPAECVTEAIASNVPYLGNLGGLGPMGI